MDSHKILVFSQRYPFSSTSRNYLKSKNIQIDNIEEPVIKRAVLMLSYAFKGKEYLPENMPDELLRKEILAFPVAKILLSYLDDIVLNEKFASMVSNSVFKYLELEESKAETMLDLAKEMEIDFNLTDPNNEKDFFIKIPIHSFIKIHFRNKSMKLVNQHVDRGMVFCNQNRFARFLSELAFTNIYSSLPVDTSNLPEIFKEVSMQLKGQLTERRKTEFNAIMKEKVDVNGFPPCYSALYSDLLEGKNLSHLARFDLATFLIAIGMPLPAIIDLFRNAPNFDEHKTRYQLERLAGKKGTRYSPPSCAKLKSHGLCPNPVVCRNYKHPVSFYRKQINKERK